MHTVSHDGPVYTVLYGMLFGDVEGTEKLHVYFHWVVVWVWNFLIVSLNILRLCVDTVQSVECNEAVSMHALPLIGCMGLIVLCVTSLPAVSCILYCCLLQ
jgi:hypothetical protein